VIWSNVAFGTNPIKEDAGQGKIGPNAIGRLSNMLAETEGYCMILQSPPSYGMNKPGKARFRERPLRFPKILSNSYSSQTDKK
jgi:hypothetical protein